MYISYTRSDFERLSGQHNIMVLVGNGFDMAVMHRYCSDRLPGKMTSYADFFEYVRYFHLCREDNRIYTEICAQKRAEMQNWRDFEGVIDRLTAEGQAANRSENYYNLLENDLMELQNAFIRFLNDVVTPDVMLRLNADAMENQWAGHSLSRFLRDLPDTASGMRFPLGLEHYNLFNYQLFNFNYTSLLDNYLYPDRYQFDAHLHHNVDTNFRFECNPNALFGSYHADWTLSGYMLLNIIHPNGMQNVPRSMIFGTEFADYQKNHPVKKMVKSFWTLNDFKYSRFFPETELFLIFGMALSNTDGWWMYRIAERLCDASPAELIIYFFAPGCTDDEIRAKFFEACGGGGTLTEEQKQAAAKNIYVIQMNGENNTNFLGFTELNPAEET